jgi:hypothetical protein
MLSLLASLALAAPPVVMQGTVTDIDSHSQATIRLEDGTTLMMREKPWQEDWQVGDQLHCTTDRRSGPTVRWDAATTTCEQS